MLFTILYSVDTIFFLHIMHKELNTIIEWPHLKKLSLNVNMMQYMIFIKKTTQTCINQSL